jgi:hypothetical protein
MDEYYWLGGNFENVEGIFLPKLREPVGAAFKLNRT